MADAAYTRETAYLQHTLERLGDKIGELEVKLVAQAAEIENLYGIYTIDDWEYYTVIPVAEQIGVQYQEDLAALRKMTANPYFGKVVFTYEDSGEVADLYIGKKAVLEFDPALAAAEPPIIDWRAPAADVYYSCKLGKTSYRVPERSALSAAPEEVGIDLHLKRTLRIREGRLESIFDADVVANDDMLMEYLSQNKELVLGEIIATIQEEQNAIIRRPYTRNLVVQGVAGSGKTTVAIHRISYLLYSFKEALSGDNVLLIAANPLFLGYITSMLPDLDVPVIRQSTMTDLLLGDFKSYISKRTVKLAARPSPGCLAPDFPQRFAAAFDALNDEIFAEEEVAFLGTVLLPAAEMRMIKGRKRPTLREKAEEMDALILKRLAGHKERIIESISYHKKDPAVQKAARERFKLEPEDIWEFNLKKNWQKFRASYKDYFMKRVKKLDSAALADALTGRPDDAWSTGDLSCCLLFYMRIMGVEANRSIRHIVIDEGQDFGAPTYLMLQYAFPAATFTIVGDIMQNIEPEGLDDWTALRGGVFFAPVDDRELRKGYRNTFEISEFARRTVERLTGRPFVIDPLQRHGEEVALLPAGTDGAQLDALRPRLAAEGGRLNAVLCKTPERAARLLKRAGGEYKALAGDAGALEYGTYILDVKSAKGLEFDTVVLWDYDDYGPADVKPLYVAMTRALHRLIVFTANSCD